MCRVMSESVGMMACMKWSQGRPNIGLGFRFTHSIGLPSA
jgi:hypothetical protein